MDTNREDLRKLANEARRSYVQIVAPDLTAVLDALEQAEARVQAVRDVVGTYSTPRVSAYAVRRALDGDT